MAEAALNNPQDGDAQWLRETAAQIAVVASLEQLEELRVAALGKKGRLTEQMKQLGPLMLSMFLMAWSLLWYSFAGAAASIEFEDRSGDEHRSKELVLSWIEDD